MMKTMLLLNNINLFLVFKLSGPKGYLKPRINRLLKKIITIDFLLANGDLLKISVFIFFAKTFTEAHCIMIENISNNKK